MAKSQSGKGKTKKRDYAHGLLMRLKRAKAENNQPVVDLIMAEINGRYYGQFFYCALRESEKKQAGLTKEDAKEVANDTLKKIAAKIKTYRERGNKRLRKKGSGGESWLMRICTNTTLDLIRKKQRTVPTDSRDNGVEPEETKTVPDRGKTPEELDEHEKRIQKLRAAWQKLSKEDQKILDTGDGKEFEEAFERLRKAYFDQPDSPK